MTEFGLWWIGVAIFFVVGFFFVCVAGTTDTNRKKKKCNYTTGYIGITNTCFVVMGIDCCCAVWAGNLGGVVGWYIASAVLCGLVGLIAIVMQVSDRKDEREFALQYVSYFPYDFYACKLKSIVEQLEVTANRLKSPSTSTCESENQELKRLQKDRRYLPKDARRIVDIKKGYVVRTTWSWIVTLITLAAVVGSCFLVNELVPKTNATYTLNEEGNYVVSGIVDGAKNVVVLSTYNGKPVVEIGNYAFRDCAELESIVLPDSITIIGESAFQNCTGLKEIVFPDSIETIGPHAFDGCKGLKNVEIPDKVESLGRFAFYGCDGLESVVWNAEDCNVRLDDNTFGDCYSLTTLTIGKNVKNFPGNTFNNCQALTNIIFSAEFCSISDSTLGSAFWSCENLKNVTISDGVKSIPEYLFCNTPLTRVVIPSSVNAVGDLAFANCKSLESVEICEGVVTIGESAFSGCEILESITIPDSVTSISDSAFYGCSKLTTVKIGKGVETLSRHAFSYCENLKNVEISSGITSIEYCAFSPNGSLTQIVFRGTKEQWMAVEKGSSWYPNSDVTIVCYDGNLDVFGSEK